MPNALITGASTGIGYAAALDLARSGYRVYATVRNPETGAPPLQEIAKEERLDLRILQLDVTDPVSCRRAIDEILEQTGRIDILVNNAGIAGPGAVEEISEAFLKTVFETNFFGALRLIRMVLPGMRERRSGTIVNISSVAGRLASDYSCAYAASKFALEAASEALAIEVRRFNIRVAIIEPGVVLTPIFEKNARNPDPDSPYAEFIRRKQRVFAKRLESPLLPEHVAKIIRHAIETDRPKLRYPVGEDAEKWLAGRNRMTDEEWVDMGKEMTDEAFGRFYLEKFGIEI